jgi:hypothetical protein
MTWSEILAHVRDAEKCDEREARRQIGNAIQDGALPARWADEPSHWGIPPGIFVPDDRPPTDVNYWLECAIDRNDPNQVREPPPYDRGLVGHRRAKRLDKARRFRAPLFPRQLALKLWRVSRDSATTAIETRAKTFLATRLRENPEMKRNDALTACRTEFPKLSGRGFKERVWPDARNEAKLERQGRPGRKPTPKIQTS